ncbi:hypothetical protein Tco_0455261, partial [Tanacetum coccineum]
VWTGGRYGSEVLGTVASDTRWQCGSGGYELVECLALADLGASINFGCLDSLWKKLSLPDTHFTQMMLVLADDLTTSHQILLKMFFILSFLLLLSLTPFEEGDFILEEIEACLTNDLIPPGIDDDDFDPEGDLLLLKKLLNDDPSSPLPPKELHVEELKIYIF